MQHAVSDLDELLKLLELDRRQLPPLDESSPFPVRVPSSFIERMRVGDPDDPLLRQVLPLGVEANPKVGFGPDPLDESAAIQGDGVISKYPGRTLLITTGACPIHCRYCFRRHFPYNENALRSSMDASLAQLAHTDHEEIILSGGDPLSLSNKRLTRLLDGLYALPNLKRLRIHTRFPVVVPQRIDTALLELLARVPHPLVVVLHVNHAQEIDAKVKASIQSLHASGAVVLNQAVLLAGVNDSVTAQTHLAEALIDAQILPYYLHQLDPVAGAAHFQVDDTKAMAIIAKLRATLPGYLVPRLVRETPGADAKTPLPI
jgi:EF-P beta-lysylation protein EpmB